MRRSDSTSLSFETKTESQLPQLRIIFVYSCDSSDAGKRQTALDLIAKCSSQGTGMLSVQVLGEFFHATVIRKKLLNAAEAEQAILAVRAAMAVVSIEFQDVADAVAIKHANGTE